MDLISEFNKTAFFESMAPFFEVHGFQFMPLLNQFRKESDSGFGNLIITPTLYSDIILFEVTFGSRINLVEQTIEPYINGLKGFKEERNTAITSLGKYKGKKYLRLKAVNRQEIKEVIRSLTGFFKEEGFAFLEQLKKIEVLDWLFNDKPEKESAVAFSHELRCFRGITLATLNQNPRWVSINQSYLTLMERHRTPGIVMSNYKRLVEFLSTSGLN